MDGLSKNALQILNKRYLLRNEKGQITETPEQLFRRVAHAVAGAETNSKAAWETKFFNAMRHLLFLPNSPTLMNAGCQNGQLSACFVLPVNDSLEDIFSTLKHTALIHQSGGGTGFNFSKLRPKNDYVSAGGGKSSGPVAFIKIYDAATEYVKQGGKRRGANMGILNIDHPDIEEFIRAKSGKNAIQNFNLSVGITDDFMNAVENNLPWHLINPRTKLVKKTLQAKDLWKLIVDEAWKTGDPGLIFLDTINATNPIPKSGQIQCTNPCGEVPLLDYESCNLGSVNLSKFVISIDGKSQVNWKKLKETIALSIRFLDNVISINTYLLPEIERMTIKHRKIGLGVMGWAELLFLLDIPYASEAAVDLANRLMRFVQQESYEASSHLATERGTFPEWENSIYYPHRPLRNATCNSIAPTGSISVIADTSYAIEPLFALAYQRFGILDGQVQVAVNSIFKSKMKALGLWNTALKNRVMKTGTISKETVIPEAVKDVFKTSMDLPWRYHLLHQKAFQSATDNAVSKTINLPETATKKDISEIFMSAWNFKLKGITIYRYGSRSQQVLRKCGLNASTDCD